MGLGHAGSPVLAGPGLAWVHLVLTHTALESRGTATEIGRATVNTEASVLAQGRDCCAWGETEGSAALSGVEGAGEALGDH